ncbi:DUF3558 domain-containing protein [Actinophytocola sp.]|uniref:DUF3558 domain-containing protein n=1 Tax=Actinophytocola sp. TaxID=1872138 RepID=UPI002D373C1A|nr:DUF3558 domain-containing protein [Actinophytocola sp.]HYQ67673.1 DUF3558 domain-containing protein [Actinophytocola sp.]
MLIRRSLLLVSLLGLALATACTTMSPGEPRATGSAGGETSKSRHQTSEGGEDLPFAGAPKVENPLGTSSYEEDPCKSLSEDQAKYLGLPSTGTIDHNVVLGVGCDWVNKETGGEVEIVFVVDDPTGLSSEYDANKRGEWKFFEELPDIEGYPAVARGDPDDRDIGHCTVVVGVADDMAFETILRLSDVNVGRLKPCDVASEVAGLALKTMKQGA